MRLSGLFSTVVPIILLDLDTLSHKKRSLLAFDIYDARSPLRTPALMILFWEWLLCQKFSHYGGVLSRHSTETQTPFPFSPKFVFASDSPPLEWSLVLPLGVPVGPALSLYF